MTLIIDDAKYRLNTDSEDITNIFEKFSRSVDLDEYYFRDTVRNEREMNRFISRIETKIFNMEVKLIESLLHNTRKRTFIEHRYISFDITKEELESWITNLSQEKNELPLLELE